MKIRLLPSGISVANLKSISRKCYHFEMKFVWKLTRNHLFADVLPPWWSDLARPRQGQGASRFCPRSPHCGLRPTTCTLHPATYTLHPTPYTLHPTPYTLRPAPCTLCTTPYA